MTTKQIIAKLKSREKAIAKERDKLRDLEDEIQMLIDSCDRASNALTEAIDALSELV